MSVPPGAFLEDLAWTEAQTRLAAGAPVLIPVGAAAKEHGAHLPLDTDAVVARALARRVADALPVVVAPVVGFGFYPAFVKFPGSQSLSAATFQTLVREIVEGFVGHGARRIAVLNTGVSTEGPLNVVASDVYRAHGVRIATAHMRLLGRAADRWIEDKAGGHADERETSVMLALDPRRVRMDKLTAPTLGRTAPNLAFVRPTILSTDPASGEEYASTGATGDPSRATAYKGERVLEAVSAELIAGLRDLWPEAFA